MRNRNITPLPVTHKRKYGMSSQASCFSFSGPMTLVLVLLISACSGGSSGLDDDDTPVDNMPTVIDGQPANDENTSEPSMDDVVNVNDPLQCDQATQNQWAYNAMQDFYLFYDQVPVVDPASYPSANDLVRDVRFQERDQFSNVSNATQSSLAFEAGREFGLGFGLRYDQFDTPRIAYVIDDSPFGLAGIKRGDIVVSVNGVGWLDALGPDLFDTVVGTPENPSSAIWQFRKANNAETVTVELTATEYAINTVVRREVIPDTDAQLSIGYMMFNGFLSTSAAELNEGLTYFLENDIDELILDLRYNGGGLVDIAAGLASVLGGESLAGQPLYEYRFNDKYTENNRTLTFAEGFGELNLDRLIVLTSDSTASASELVIAGLRPYMDVITIGTRTVGKPFISFGYERCDERLNIIEVEGFNAAGVSVFGGIPADCYAADDLTRDFGLSESNGLEGQLLAGLNFISNGTCETEPAMIASRQADRSSTRTQDRHFGLGLSAANGAVER